jgi:hypothetical protein
VFPHVGTQASFDAEQKNRHQTHRRSHSARMPNIRRAKARTLSTYPGSRSRGECSAMCGGSITYLKFVKTISNVWYKCNKIQVNQLECSRTISPVNVELKTNVSDISSVSIIMVNVVNDSGDGDREYL